MHRWMRKRQPGFTLEVIEKGLAYPAGESYLWYQYALALTAAGKHARAMTALGMIFCSRTHARI